MEEILVTLLLLSLGLSLLVVGILYLLGHYKAPYFSSNSRWVLLVQMGIGFGTFKFSLGLGMILSLVFPNNHLLGYIFPSILLWIALLTPFINFLWLLLGFKPKWIKWLEIEHRDSLPLLVSEARKMGIATWEERVKTQAKLESWVSDILLENRSLQSSNSSELKQ